MTAHPEDVSGAPSRPLSSDAVGIPDNHTGVVTPEWPTGHRDTAPRSPGDTSHGSPAPDTGPDWRTMTRADFDTGAPPETLFELEPGAVCAVDPCGTGDILELLEGDA